MITITIIICLTVIIIVAIICYKEYKLSNNCSFVTIECDLKSLSRKLELNNSILESLAESISHLPKQGNRLNIAAQIVASMIGSDDWTTWHGGSNKEIWHNMAKSSLEIADALIAEAEKGGSK